MFSFKFQFSGYKWICIVLCMTLPIEIHLKIVACGSNNWVSLVVVIIYLVRNQNGSSDASIFHLGVLVGNKTDKENYRVVSTQEGKQLAASRKMAFFECSAVSEIVSMNGKNVSFLSYRKITKVSEKSLNISLLNSFNVIEHVFEYWRKEHVKIFRNIFVVLRLLLFNINGYIKKSGWTCELYFLIFTDHWPKGYRYLTFGSVHRWIVDLILLLSLM